MKKKPTKTAWNAGRIAGEISRSIFKSESDCGIALKRRIARALREAYKRGGRAARTAALICEELQPRRIVIEDDDDETERGF